ncbi:hypothetical protein A2572_01275 [Candidatus Collierbacteria bacterium RIFOXYD1_FULL_40_9]|uniref:Uncharacterized protein n=1 Tax=Candidatus Collierbacteria bacterium RIFOXYD1_FULL_40_9 TaxID=1817731 RepID=A0A1F5FT68_9BACT|nr:MAG: hypothetical protein A2572_01275 [Candidatus Collierbacteria bacterium RIFOXYD1_FULL_40_9]
MNNLPSLTPKTSIFEVKFDDKWQATISFGKDTYGTISLPGYKDIGGFKTAIHLLAMGISEFAISSINFVPLLIYKVEKETGRIYDIKSLPLNWGKDDLGSEHWISTQAISAKTNQLVTVTFALCRKQGKDFTLTLLED